MKGLITISKYTQHQLNQMEVVDIYKLVLRGDIKRFPTGFWQRPDALDNARKVTKFLIEDILKWNEEDIKEKFGSNIFKENKLQGMLDIAFKSSPFKVINNTYPNKFKPWEFRQTHKNYWTSDKAILATKWMIEEKLKWNDEDIKNKLTLNTFKIYNLSGALMNAFNNSTFKAINTVYPNRFKPWDLTKTPQNYWNLETAKEATKWLIEEKLKWNDEDIKSKLTQDTFSKNNLGGMINIVFKGSPFKAIESIYPNKFKPWELINTVKNYWTLETGILATKWLIEEKLKWTDEDIKNKLTNDLFFKYSLGGMLQIIFNSSTYTAINTVYPNKFKPWELIRSPQSYWNLETAKEATIWMIEEKLKWNDEDIKNKLDYNTFKNNGLAAMLVIILEGSTFLALENAYPNRFNKYDLKGYSQKKLVGEMKLF